MTQQQINYVMTLAKERSFSKAAKVLFVSQPSLSQYIKSIEQQLGVELFDRSTSPLKITLAGEAYLRAAEKIRSANEELSAEIADLNELKSGRLTIGTSSFCASCLLPKSLSMFHKTYPGIELHIKTEALSNLVAGLLNGSLDCIIDTCKINEEKINTSVLYPERYYLAVEKEHSLCKRYANSILTAEDIISESTKIYTSPVIDLSCLKDETMLLPNQSQSLYAICNEIFEHAKVTPKSIFYTDHVETSFYWAIAGMGVALIPDTLIRFGKFMEHPIYFPINPSVSEHNILVAFRKNRYISSSAKIYLSTLRTLIGQGTWHSSSMN